MAVLEMLKDWNLAFFKMEMEKILESINETLAGVGVSEKLDELKSVSDIYRKLYYMAGFSGLLSISELAVMAAEFIEQVTQTGTVYSREFLKVLKGTNSRIKKILDAVDLESDSGYFVGPGKNIILTPPLIRPVTIEDITALYKKWLIDPAEISTMRKIRIAKDSDFGHSIKIPPYILRTRKKSCYLTLVYLDISAQEGLDDLILQLRGIEKTGTLLLQGPLEIPYENFIDNDIKNPYYLLLQTETPAESYLSGQGLKGRIIRVLKKPDPMALKREEPRVIVKEVPYTAPEIMETLELLIPEEKRKKLSAEKDKKGASHEKIGRVKIRFSIGVKMITFISLIILLSLTLVTVISSREFMKNNKKSIEQDYLNKADILGDAVKEFFKSRINAVNLLFLGLEQSTDENRKMFIDNFFDNNRDVIYIALLNGNGESQAYFNERYQEEITSSSIETLYISEADSLNRDYLDLPYIFNPSYLFKEIDENRTMVIGVTAFSQTMKQPILILINIRDFMRNNFPSVALYTAYVVNNDSQIILHTNPEMVTAARSVQRKQIEDLVIVDTSTGEETRQRITDYLFNIGSNPTQETAQPVKGIKEEKKQKLSITVRQEQEDGSYREVGLFRFLLNKFLSRKEQSGTGAESRTLQSLREIEGGRDFSLILGEYQDIFLYRWLAKYMNKDKISYFVYLKRIQAEDDYRLGVVLEVEVDRIREAVNNILRTNILILLIVLAFTILALYFFSKSMTSPMRSLVTAARKIEAGQFDIKLKVRTHDELGVLTGAFIDMGIGLEEKERMKDAFGRFVNQEVADMAMRGEIGLGGERKNATVFFSDIRNFTAISEKLEPEEVVGFLNEYMTIMVGYVNQNKGFVDKYIGDAIMAVWGAPISYGRDEENCLNAALMMRKALIEFNKDRGTSEKKPVIRIGCGINSGPVLAGQIGSNERMEYTVIGDTVNLASRIEALNKPMGTDILISQQTSEIVNGIFDLVPMNKIKVKGKKEPQQIYAVLGRMDDPERPKSLKELRRRVGIVGQYENIADAEEKEIKYEILD